MAPDSEPTPRVPWLPVDPGAERPTPPAEPTLTPTKPVVPAWIRRDDAPAAVEADTGEIIAPVVPPAAEEIMPRLGDGMPAFDEPHVTDAPDDPVARLGQSAVAAAALSAGGAPTPLGGVPTLPTDRAVEPPSFGEAGAIFTPRFAEPAATAPSPRERADTLAAGIVAEESAELAARATPLESGAAYTPRAITPPAGDDTAEPDATGDGTAGTRRTRRWWPWALLGLVLVGAGVAAYLITNRPDPTVIPGVTITQPAPAPTIEPSAAPTGTAFQSVMPTEVGTYALVGSAVLDPLDPALGLGRIADGVDLTYRSGTDTMSVRALQYYNEDDAQQMFGELVGEDAATKPVVAAGSAVGDSAYIIAPQPGIVWRNGTSVFIVTGPTAQLTDFFAQFGL